MSRSDSAHVLVVGANFENRGANLMLMAVRDALARVNLRATLDYRTGTPSQRRFYGVETLVPRRLELSRMPTLAVANPVLPFRFRFVYPAQIRAVVDMSGFRYGDEWSNLDLGGSASRLRAWRTRGVPVIALPQAFGPFLRTESSAAILLEHLDRIYARDQESLAHLEALGAKLGLSTERLRICPDFTSHVPGTTRDRDAAFTGRAVVVANWNLSERGSGSDAYVTQLIGVVQHMRNAGLDPFGMSHEGKRDADLLRRVAEEVGSFEVVENVEASRAKAILGSARIVLSGRYHASVSALAQGVPTIMHAWSHKYEWLARDFGVSGFVCSPSDPLDVLRGLVDQVLENEVAIKDALAVSSVAVDRQVRQMWADVVEIVSAA